MGAEPLVDEHLPAGTDALVLGGGFPEMPAAELAANTALAADVRRMAVAGWPIVTECGGLLYLCQELDGTPMANVLDASATFTNRLTLGYRDAVVATDGPLGPVGTVVRGHEFHRTVTTPRSGRLPAWQVTARGHSKLEGFVAAGVHASYLQASWVGTPEVVGALSMPRQVRRPPERKGSSVPRPRRGREHRIMAALQHTEVPVPPPVGLRTDEPGPASTRTIRSETGPAAVTPARDRLKVDFPQPGPPAIVHGDYRMDDMIVGDHGCEREIDGGSELAIRRRLPPWSYERPAW